ncbi:MAG: hypothetical protein PHE79_01630 [Eubacteriales bacterium]|nr:hypothetical protein [Eubacteriales bacterium]
MKRKRIKRLVLVLILLLVLVIVLAAFFLMGQNSEGKKQYEAQIKQETQNFTEKIVSELDKIDTTDEGLAAGITDVPPEEAPPEIITETEKEIVSKELAKLEDERKQQVLQVLSVAYSKALEQQKQTAFSMADNLIAQAKADWKAAGSSGKADPVKRGAMISEYLAKVKVMEAQMDAGFGTLTAKMDEQLRAEGIDPAALIAQYKAEYNKIKEENKDALMSKAMASVKN